MSPGVQPRDLFDLVPCGLISATTRGDITTANDTFLAMVGRMRDQVVGQHLTAVLAPGSRLYFETGFLQQLSAHGRASEVAFDLQLADGKTLSVFVNAVVDADRDGGTLLLAVFDATVRRHYERELLAARRVAERSETRVRILQTATTAFGAAASEGEVTEALAEAVRGATDATVVSVHLRAPDGSFTARATAGAPRPLAETALLAWLDEGAEAAATGSTSPSGGTQVLPNSAELRMRFPSAVAELRAARIEALAIVPLIDDGATGGVILLSFGRPRRLDAQTVDLLDSLAEQSVLVLQRLRLRELISYRSLHDTLTGLPNRLSLQLRLDHLLTETRPSQQAVALLFIDLDGFKSVNDRFGHLAGDTALRRISTSLHQAVRSGDMVGRLGGDEFLLICEDADEQSLADIAERLRSAVRNTPLEEGLHVSASVGVSIHRPDSSREKPTAEALITLADEAMYQSKRAGKDRATIVVA
ncbi:PAS domain S-box protein [Subtercola sp. Z020]|nr:PAS domain S-box protein [Subtercola sp. Z020]